MKKQSTYAAYIPPESDPLPFKKWLTGSREHKAIFWSAAIAVALQFSVFKYFYPYASYIHGDSFVYIETASKNLGINTYMIGYSMFLRLFSVFSTSDMALVATQYIMIQVAALFLLFTLFYFYRPGKPVRIGLLCFMVFNPLFLYLGNLVSSDAFFVALSLIWFALLLWIIHRPQPELIFWHTAIIFLTFTVRYNGLIYFPISCVAFLLSRYPWRIKVAGIATGALAISLFVLYNGNQYKRLTGTWQYSPFFGWQLANNAMYTYRYVDSSEREPVPARFKELDNRIRAHFDSTRDFRKYLFESLKANTMYMWSPFSPLYKYRNGLFKKDTAASELKKWASMGPLYKDYGLYIIRKYPWHFAEYFLWPNGNKYYAPPVEFLESYNSGKDSVPVAVAVWFGYKSRRLTTRTKDLRIRTLDFYPILSGVVNMGMLLGLLSFAVLGGFRRTDQFMLAVIIGSTVWILNAGFTIFASSAALRFQAFPILLATTFSALLIDWMVKLAHAIRSAQAHAPGDRPKEREPKHQEAVV